MRGRGRVAVRVLLLLAATAGTGVPVHALCDAPLRAAAAAAAGHDPAVLSLDRLVVLGCAAALAACWLWLAACVLVVALGSVREGANARPARRVRGCPRVVQALVLLGLGVTVASPAHASTAHAGPTHRVPAPAGAAAREPGPGVTGLALPDRVDGGRTSPALVRVRRGDSLWRVARRLLPSAASDAEVDRTWRRLAELNADRLGPDPDLIFPGTLLRVPAPGRALGKDDR